MTATDLSLGLPAAGGARRCGKGRSAGGLYLEVGLSPFGSPIESFLFDPTRPIPQTIAQTMTKIGVQLIPTAPGQPHDVLDWVGQSHYAYATDFIEEGRIKGFSRKVSPGLDFSLLGPGSRIVFAHARGHVENHADYLLHLPDFACPCGQGHGPGDDCIGLLYRTAPGELTGPDGHPARLMLPGGPTYRVGPLAPGAPEPQYQPAMFAWAPITNIALIANPDGSFDQVKYAAAAASGLPVTPAEE